MNGKLIINTNLLRKEPEYRTNSCVVEKAAAVSHAGFESLKRHPLQDNYLIEANADLMRCDSDNNYHCLLIYDEEQGDGMLIESEGAAYARYSVKRHVKHKKRENPKKAVKKQNTPYKLRIYGVYEV